MLGGARRVAVRLVEIPDGPGLVGVVGQLGEVLLLAAVELIAGRAAGSCPLLKRPVDRQRGARSVQRVTLTSSKASWWPLTTCSLTSPTPAT